MARLPSPLQKIEDPLFDENEVEVFLKRDDLIHPEVMGNKWRKLSENLRFANEAGYRGILTVGGAFSNHIAATAAACYACGLQSRAMIRGEELHEQSNPTLRFAASRNMRMQFVSREEFRRIKKDFDQLQEQFPDYYCLPEGGTNARAISGCEAIVQEIDIPYDYIVAPVGTGGTLAGIVKALKGQKKVIGFAALKGAFVKEDFDRLLKEHNIPFSNYEINTDFHFGGYGKVTRELIDFINQTKMESRLLYDPVYTGKMYFGLKSLIRGGVFAPGIRIIVVHTGGIQGIAGYNESHEHKILQ